MICQVLTHLPERGLSVCGGTRLEDMSLSTEALRKSTCFGVVVGVVVVIVVVVVVVVVVVGVVIGRYCSCYCSCSCSCCSCCYKNIQYAHTLHLLPN